MRKSQNVAAALLIGGSLLGTGAQAVTASVYVQVVPAAPRYEYWGYTPGVWTQAQYGYDRHWDQYRRFESRRRSPDRDRDGIPDYRDRDLDNDGRRNDRDWDVDGDGVANRYDRDPYNRYRR
jgi:hypothetical protein